MTFFPTSIFVTLFLSFSIALSQSQNNVLQINDATDTRITKITYSSSGGRGGYYVNLDITSTSTVYVQGNAETSKTIKEKTSKTYWNSLTKALNLRDFDQVKSDPGHSMYDGIDITITVVSRGKTHTLVNGSTDMKQYIRINGFTDLLEKKLASLRERIK